MSWDDIYKKTGANRLNALSQYLYAAGGLQQESRMIKDKRRSLDRAVKYSYQGALVKKNGSTENVPALINPNKVKEDYDDKIISVGFEYNISVGDVVEWNQTGSYWLVYLQELTELAYFRGNIRKCSQQISWVDEDGTIQTTYAAVVGPAETTIDNDIKHDISVDSPNYSLNILMPKTDASLDYFQRYSKFYLKNGEVDVCWEVQVVDWISTPGILQIVAKEDYANPQEDDIENGLVGSLIVEPVDPNTSVDIIGETFIKPKKQYTYSISAGISGEWNIDSNCPVDIISKTSTEITLKWTSNYSGQFELNYGDYQKVIVAESLF